MFDRLINQVCLDLSLRPAGPILVRSGRTGIDPSRPSLECVRTHLGGSPSVYLPGSSLKGVMRSHAECLLRSLGLAVKDPFDREAQQAFDQKADLPTVFAASCPIGRTFGNTHLRGHLALSDFLPGAREAAGSPARLAEVNAANRVELRNGVGIDRLTGSSFHGALYDQEVVVGGRFDGRITLKNVQLYQIALLLCVLQDLGEGFVRLGSGTTRGLGEVALTVHRLTVEFTRGACTDRRLRGLGALVPGVLPELFAGDEVDLPASAAFKAQPRLVWEQWSWSEPAALTALREALLAGPWARFIEAGRGRGWQC